jgi:hypothetical protein
MPRSVPAPGDDDVTTKKQCSPLADIAVTPVAHVADQFTSVAGSPPSRDRCRGGRSVVQTVAAPD